MFVFGNDLWSQGRRLPSFLSSSLSMLYNSQSAILLLLGIVCFLLRWFYNEDFDSQLCHTTLNECVCVLYLVNGKFWHLVRELGKIPVLHPRWKWSQAGITRSPSLHLRTMLTALSLNKAMAFDINKSCAHSQSVCQFLPQTLYVLSASLWGWKGRISQPRV